MATSYSSVPLSQDELKIILAHLNNSIKGDRLQIGDIVQMLPVIQKLESKLDKIEPPKAEETKN